MVSTLDTNIVVNVALENQEDREKAKSFMSQTSPFLTAQVSKEITKIEERITAFEMLLESHMEEDKSPFEVFEKIEEKLTGSLQSRLNGYFRNIAQYYEKKYDEGQSIEKITNDLTYEISVYSSIDRIRPTQENWNQNLSKAEEYEGYIEENELVDREDVGIIVQLQVHQDARGGNIELITRDSGFHTGKEEWDEMFPNISVNDLS